MQLTVTQCKLAKARSAPYKLNDGKGLYLEVMPSGAKYWRFQYSLNGRRPRIALGVFPDTSLLDARAAREENRRLVRMGHDPAEERRKARLTAQVQSEATLEAITLEWHRAMLDQWTKGHARDVLHRFQTDVFPDLGAIPIQALQPLEILTVIRKIEARGAPELARRALQNIGRVCRYAAVTGRATHDPSYRLWEALKPAKTSHYAAITIGEIPEFLRVLRTNEGRLLPVTQIATELLMLTFVRTGELIAAQWNELDLDAKQWIIPADRMKRNRVHIVPLSRQALTLIEKLDVHRRGSCYLFPHCRDPLRHLSNNTILRALERMGYRGRMTGHGFRALAMSAIKEKLGYRHEVIDRQLAHQPQSKIDRAYDRAEFLNDRTIMMQAWADFLDDQYKAALSGAA